MNKAEPFSKTTRTPPKPKASYLPAEEGVWMFVLGDMIIFGLFFVVYLYYRNFDIAAFNESQALLNVNYGVINTILLLTSSWFVVTGIEAVRKAETLLAKRLFLLAFCCGLGFGLVKFVEWSEKIRAGYTLLTNDFFMYYYILTGIHFLHVIIGMVVLAFMINKTKHGQSGPDHIGHYESGGVYWHMVDLLWIVLFPLLYLIS